ncbi:MAG: histidine phosphatase family protein, partial [Acidimicrobiia bacterium]|nr:histidine phosphatase family protein [Acidimicrobiia bacterium]
MEFIFVRHGEPEWSIDGISQNDPGLTARGHQQSRLVAEFLAGQERPITEILVSPARRAEETAAPIVSATGIRPTVVADLVEIGMPDWSTTPEHEVQSQFKEARQRHPRDWWTGMPGGEAFDDFHKRVSSAVTEVSKERGAVALEGDDRHLWRFNGDPAQRIAVVAHAGTNTAALGSLLHIDPTPWEWDRFALGHASISRVRLIPLCGEHVFSMRALNDRVHLP